MCGEVPLPRMRTTEPIGPHEHQKGTKLQKMCLFLCSLRGRCQGPISVKALLPSLGTRAQAQVNQENEAPCQPLTVMPHGPSPGKGSLHTDNTSLLARNRSLASHCSDSAWHPGLPVRGETGRSPWDFYMATYGLAFSHSLCLC